MAKNDQEGDPADPNEALSRRTTLKLAAAVGALGAGLGALLEADEAQADDWEAIKLDQKGLGALALKIYEGNEKEPTLLKSLDISEYLKLKAGPNKDSPHHYSLKFFYVQYKERGAPALLASHAVQVTSEQLKLK